MHSVSDLLKVLQNEWPLVAQNQQPKGLYEPIDYILQLPGKRIRPVLTLLTATCYGDFQEAIEAAKAVEIFHNFTLVHDDIMDEAPLRRGNQTVHHKWDLNTGILSGDAMLIKAYQCLQNYPPEVLAPILQLFNQTALQVCEGQQWDVEFEQMETVTEDQYLQMIQYKTAVLLGCAMQMGAIVQKANPKEAQLWYDFGLQIGTAFQIQDDYLDCFGNPETFGKQVGGDIIENKKTYLYIHALELLSDEDKQQLLHLYSLQPENPHSKIEAVKNYFVQSGAAQKTLDAVKSYSDQAFSILDTIDVSEVVKAPIRALAQQLMHREQ